MDHDPTRITCGTPRERLWDFVHSEPGEADPALSGHVASCDGCAAQVRSMQALLGNLSGIHSGNPAPPQAGASASVPEQIGDYRIIRRVGAGGMGVVFEAEQSDPRRRVALKVLRDAALADDARVRLFRREMQTLARLNHPGIAAIHGAGLTAEGRPFFTMELVEGLPLTQFADGVGGRERLTLRGRLELMLGVCQAVSYAHQRGVIHRDLKPGNILVVLDARGRPQPKVLDFGLARISDETAAATSFVSIAGSIVGTLAYMSPEQARADASLIDVRTDVYALGAMLYELLTGHCPLALAGLPLHEAVRVICQQEPAPPQQGNPAVPADVAAITLRSLEKSVERRYQTADELADDLLRYLSNHPVKARRPSAFYRLRKLVARNRLTVSFLSLILLLLSGAAGGFAWQATHVAQQRDLAQREALKFREINDVLTSVLAAGNTLNPWQSGSRDTRVIDVLDAAAARIVEDVRDPLAAAALRHTLGQTYRSLSELSAACTHLAYAVQTRTALLGTEDFDTLDSLAERGEALFEHEGASDEALQSLEAALQGFRAQAEPSALQVSRCLNSIGLLLQQRGQFDASERALREALQMRRTLAAEAGLRGASSKHAQTGLHDNLAQTLNNLAGLLRRRATAARAGGDARRVEALLRDALPLYEEALALRRAWRGESHPEVAKMRNNLARCLQDLGRLDEAAEHQRAALELLDAGLGQRHRYSARARYNLATLLAERGQTDAARELCGAALRVQEELLEPSHPEIRDSRALLERLR